MKTSSQSIRITALCLAVALMCYLPKLALHIWCNSTFWGSSVVALLVAIIFMYSAYHFTRLAYKHTMNYLHYRNQQL